MQSFGKNIEIYLMDGNAEGRWQANLSNWNGIAYKIPKNMLDECFSDLTELNAPGVYFLFGYDNDLMKQFVYIGEGDDVLKRLSQPHSFEKDNSAWTEAIIFITPDGTLEKGHIKYLENRFYNIAKDSDRYIIKNANTPTQSTIPKKIRDLLEEFILNCMLMLPILGHFTFEPNKHVKTKKSEKLENTDHLLYFSRNGGKGGEGTGKRSPEGFWVLKGSYINPEIAPYTPNGIIKLREKYADSIDETGILKKDLLFSSPSYAASFICGKTANGRADWKNKNGTPLKELNEQNLSPNKVISKQKEDNINTHTEKNFDEPIFHLAGKKANAKGFLTDSGFTVLRGSDFYNPATKACPDSIKKIRDKLITEGKVKDGKFLENVTFTSTSAAAGCITGSSVNGNTMWLNAKGKTLKEIYENRRK